MIAVASYNIHRGIGTDGRRDWERIRQVISALDVDVLALQEVETPAEPAPSASTLALLPQLSALGYAPLLGPTLRDGDADYGNLLLSRWPIARRHQLDLSLPGREPRGLIEADIASGQQRLCVMATHLGLGRRERRRQVARIAQRLDQRLDQPIGRPIDRLGSAAPRTPLVLLGDFNHWFPGAHGLKPLRARLSAVPARRSYPTGWPLLALDRIFHGGDLRLVDWGVARGSAARRASDHYPVWARFD